jgi:flagellin FlaB
MRKKDFHPGMHMIPSAISIRQSQRGITGLETAIILIAFVVVAAIFAFTVLSVGIFSTERSKETVYSGLEQTSSSLDPKGGMIALTGSVSGTTAVTQVRFTLAPSVSGDIVDVTPPFTANATGTDPDASGLASTMVLSYTDGVQHINEAAWTVEFTGYSNGDYLLDREEQVEITVWLHQKDNGTGNFSIGTAGSNYLTTRLGMNTKFMISVNSSAGATFSMERTLPPRLTSVIDLR